jgi:polysaccharide export outer membrane protein
MRLHAATIAALLALVTAPIGATQEPAVVPPAATSYRLAPGDVIDLKFTYNPELNETVTLRPDGCISLQMIGDLHADGLTPLELTTRVNERYGKLIRRPDAAVIVRNFAAQKVYVGGEVMAPGMLDLRGRLTSLQAILQTGGVRPSAKTNSVLLMRYHGDNRAEVRKLDLQRVLNGRDEDPVLHAFDVVFVPRSAIAKVGLFMEQHVNSLIPRSLMFPYNLNTAVTVK